MNYKIDWENLTKEEAQEIANLLCASYSIIAKCYGVEGLNDVSYLTVAGVYDDNFHGDNKVKG